MEDIAGRFAGWMQRQPRFATAVVTSFVPVDGGASNLTYRVGLQDGPYEWIALRLQRETGIFQPYDVVREGKVVAALADTAVPVPEVAAVEPDRRHLGAPFVVLQWVDAPHMGLAGPEADYGAFTQMVATIHSVDWRVEAFSFLDQPPDVTAATREELAAVVRRIEAFNVQEPLLDRALGALENAIPAEGELALCQGDINVFNYLFRNREVVAVVDWEQARIGDPRSDVGQLVTLSHLKGAPFGRAEEAPFARAYAVASGRPLAGLEYFRAMWAWQLAFIHRAWLASNDTEPWYSWDGVTGLLERCLEEIG